MATYPLGLLLAEIKKEGWNHDEIHKDYERVRDGMRSYYGRMRSIRSIRQR